MEIKGKVLYSGIDWLTIGIFAEAKNIEHWEEKIEEYKKLLGTTIDEKNFKYEILTSKQLAEQRYTIMLRETKFNIAIKITHAPKKSKITQVKNGIVKMPDFLIEIPARALRPQNIYYTENFIKFIMEKFNAKMIGFIYSRVDFNTDIYNTSEEFIKNIIDSFYSKKEKKNYEINYSETTINKKLISIKKGQEGYKALSIYRTGKRDYELIEIYRDKLKETIDKEKLNLIWRFELRISRNYLRLHKDYEISKIHLTEFLSLKRILFDAYSIFEEETNIKELSFLFKEQEHIQIKGYWKEHNKLNIKQVNIQVEDIYKQILGLFNKASEILKEEYEIIRAEDTFNHFFMSLKRMKQYIEEKAIEKKTIFFQTLEEAINYIKDYAKSIFKEFYIDDNELVEEEINFKKYNYEEFRGVAPKTQTLLKEKPS